MSPTDLVRDGVLQTWLLESASARQLGLEPTGHAVRGGSGAPGVGTSNTYLAPGKASRDDLFAGIARGVYVTELIGMGVNGVTGDYSRGAAGFLIEDGADHAAGRRVHHRRQSDRYVPQPDRRRRSGVPLRDQRADAAHGMTIAGG